MSDYMARIKQGDGKFVRVEALRLLNLAVAQDYDHEWVDKAVEILQDGVDTDEVLEKVVEVTDRFSRRLEGAWAVKLAQKNSINAQHMVAIFTNMFSIARRILPPEMSEKFETAVKNEIVVSKLAPSNTMLPGPTDE